MICDHIGCKIPPHRAPRLVVPARWWLMPGHRAIKCMTTLHYCELHKGEVQLGDLLTAEMRRRIEKVGKSQRPIGYKPDFDKAFIEYVLITTPEYRAFLRDLGAGGIRLLLAA